LVWRYTLDVWLQQLLSHRSCKSVVWVSVWWLKGKFGDYRWMLDRKWREKLRWGARGEMKGVSGHGFWTLVVERMGCRCPLMSELTENHPRLLEASDCNESSHPLSLKRTVKTFFVLCWSNRCLPLVCTSRFVHGKIIFTYGDMLLVYYTKYMKPWEDRWPKYRSPQSLEVSDESIEKKSGREMEVWEEKAGRISSQPSFVRPRLIWILTCSRCRTSETYSDIWSHYHSAKTVKLSSCISFSSYDASQHCSISHKDNACESLKAVSTFRALFHWQLNPDHSI
jgi:hypothetical protein